MSAVAGQSRYRLGRAQRRHVRQREWLPWATVWNAFGEYAGANSTGVRKTLFPRTPLEQMVDPWENSKGQGLSDQAIARGNRNEAETYCIYTR